MRPTVRENKIYILTGLHSACLVGCGQLARYDACVYESSPPLHVHVKKGVREGGGGAHTDHFTWIQSHALCSRLGGFNLRECFECRQGGMDLPTYLSLILIL